MNLFTRLGLHDLLADALGDVSTQAEDVLDELTGKGVAIAADEGDEPGTADVVFNGTFSQRFGEGCSHGCGGVDGAVCE